jgi:hypothetical protein
MGSWIDTGTKPRHCGGKTGRNIGLYDTSEISRLIHWVTYFGSNTLPPHNTFLLCLSTWDWTATWNTMFAIKGSITAQLFWYDNPSSYLLFIDDNLYHRLRQNRVVWPFQYCIEGHIYIFQFLWQRRRNKSVKQEYSQEHHTARTDLKLLPLLITVSPHALSVDVILD